MNYRHVYHAGNIADVFKHIVLLGLLQSLTAKDSPYFVLDTHAGIGAYDLQGVEAGKTGEYQQGIGGLWGKPAQNELLRDYLMAVQNLNPDGQLLRYPGSPWLIASQLREIDRSACCELHPEDFVALKRTLRLFPHAAAHCRSGYEAIGALLPPIQKRGLILIDPPFEVTNELDQVAAAVKSGQQRFAGASWAIWYPIKDRAAIWRFHESMAAVPASQLALEFMTTDAADSRSLNGSGILLIKPPYQCEARLLPALNESRQHLGLPGQVNCEWLKV